MQKRTLDLILLGVFVLLAVLLYQSTASFPKIAQKTTANYVRFLALVLGGLSFIQLFLTLKAAGYKEKIKWMDNPARFIGLLVLLFIYAAFLGKLGFFISTALFIPAACWLLGYRRIIPVVLSTLITLGFIYLVFVKLLAVHLPQGNLL